MWNDEALPSEWNKNFRMPREQFVMLADELSPLKVLILQLLEWYSALRRNWPSLSIT